MKVADRWLVTHQAEIAFLEFLANEADARAEELGLSRVIQRVLILRFDAALEGPRRYRHRLTGREHRRTVLCDPWRFLLLEDCTHIRGCRHRDTRLVVTFARQPGAVVVNDLPVLVVVHPLAEVVHGAILVLGVIVQRLLHKFAIFERSVAYHYHLDAGHSVRLRQDRHFYSGREAFTRVRV